MSLLHMSKHTCNCKHMSIATVADKKVYVCIVLYGYCKDFPFHSVNFLLLFEEAKLLKVADSNK